MDKERETLHHCSDSPGHSLHLQPCVFVSGHLTQRRKANTLHGNDALDAAAATVVTDTDSQGLSESAHPSQQEPVSPSIQVFCSMIVRNILGFRLQSMLIKVAQRTYKHELWFESAVYYVLQTRFWRYGHIFICNIHM